MTSDKISLLKKAAREYIDAVADFERDIQRGLDPENVSGWFDKSEKSFIAVLRKNNIPLPSSRVGFLKSAKDIAAGIMPKPRPGEDL